MMIDNTPLILLSVLLVLLFTGVLVMIWGKKVPDRGGWATLGASVMLLGGMIFGLSVLAKEEPHSKSWLVGWIAPKAELGAITLGLVADLHGLAMTTMLALIAIVLFTNRGILGADGRSEKFFSGMAFSVCGVTLSWMALTPWMSFLGIAIVIFGGFLSFGEKWDTGSEASVAIRFGWERSWGLIAALLGTYILASSRAPLSYGGESWSQGGSHLDFTGAVLLVSGLLIQLQAFPFLGWLSAPTNVAVPIRSTLTQLFPVWAVFAVLIRLEPQMRSMGVFPVLGWVGLGSALLTTAAGFFQVDWKQSIVHWFSAGFAMAFAALAFAGAWAAEAALIGLSLGGTVIALSGTALEVGGTATAALRKRGIWAKISLFLGAAAGTGAVGFISAGGWIRWIASGWDQPAVAVVFGTALFFLMALGWRQAWMISRLKTTTQAGWAAVLSPLILVMIALGLVWSGTASGGSAPHDLDRLFASALNRLLGENAGAVDETVFVAASGIYWGVFVLAFGFSFWTSGREEDGWTQLRSSLPGFSGFLSEGYRIDLLGSRALLGVRWLGNWTMYSVDQKAWNQWFPSALNWSVQRGARSFLRLDSVVWGRVAFWLNSLVEIPAKLLQLMQSGNVQWYLLFAVGAGIAMLIHFLKFYRT